MLSFDGWKIIKMWENVTILYIIWILTHRVGENIISFFLPLRQSWKFCKFLLDKKEKKMDDTFLGKEARWFILF